MDKYYRILGVQKGASLAQIKQAYRKKAKEYHPDVSKDSKAREKFILVNEAWEFLQNEKTGKHYNAKKEAYTSASQDPYYRNKRNNWQENQQKEAQRRARQHAKMKYEEFLNSHYYKTAQALDNIANHVALLFAASFLIIIPIFLLFFEGLSGFLASVFVILITLPFWRQLFSKKPQINPFLAAHSLLHLFKIPSVQLIVLNLTNLYVFLKIGLSTLIPLYGLIGIYLVAWSIGWLSVKFNKRRNSLKVATIGTWSLISVSILLTVNFIFSNQSAEESYEFKFDSKAFNQSDFVVPSNEKSTFIYLENDQYQLYPGLRVFLDFRELQGKNHIKYKFETGLLGIRVLKNHTFY